MSTETVVDESFDYEIDKFSGEVLFPRIAILKLCKELHVRCMAHPVIAEPGYGRIQFDFGVYKSRKELAFLIEYDGPAHYDVDITDRFMISYGLRKYCLWLIYRYYTLILCPCVFSRTYYAPGYGSLLMIIK